MKKKIRQKRKRKKIEFSLHAPQAKDVCLLGDFNKWNGKKHNFKKGKLGTWKKSLMLFPGTYEYKYSIDGSWQEDPENSQKCVNVFGTYNNVITIPE